MTGREMLIGLLQDLSPEPLREAAEGLADIIASRIEKDAEDRFLGALERVLEGAA